MGRPRTNDEVVKERLLSTATELLATEPPDSITVRALASAAGATTAAVYTLFGSKDALMEQVRQTAVIGLFDDLSAVPTTDDPLADLYALAVAYRHWAREHRHLYMALFGGVQTFDPSGAVGAVDPVRPLVETIERALSLSVLVGDPASIAVSIWITLHGLVTLELAGALESATADSALTTTVPALLRGWTGPFPQPSA